MSANLDALIREGVSAFKAGRKDEAHAMFIKATELDPYREEAWLWLSATVESVEDQRTCLENVLSINPNNQRAQQGLSLLAPAENTAADFFDPPHVSAFSAPVPGSNAPKESPAWSGIATSSASASWDPNSELSDEDYDNWVSNLNLPSSGSASSSTPPFPAPITTPADAILATSNPFDTDEDEFFGGGPFSAADFGMSESEDDERANEMLAALRTPSPTPTPTTPPAPIPSVAVPVRTMPAAPPNYHPPVLARPAMSPVPEEPPAPPKRRDEDFERLFGSSDDFSLLEDIDRDRDGVPLEEGEGELFGFIPQEIKATRLPGTRERVPLLLIVGVFALVLVNLGAAVLLAYRLLPS